MLALKIWKPRVGLSSAIGLCVAVVLGAWALDSDRPEFESSLPPFPPLSFRFLDAYTGVFFPLLSFTKAM